MFSFINLLGIIFITIYMALMYDNEALVLLGYMEAVFYVVSLFVVLFRKLTIKGMIHIPITISETEKDNLIKIIIRNGSPISLTRLKAYIIVENTITGNRQARWMSLGKTHDRDTVYVRNLVLRSAGNYKVIMRKLRIYDITGLMYGDININSFQTIQVVPKLYDVPVKLTMAIKNFYGESDVHDAHKPGYDNSELFQVREYQNGDRLQNVHWKMTAKQDEIMVKEHSLPKSCPVILFLNFYELNKSKKKSKFIMYSEIAASLSYSIMDAGCPHYVAWYDIDDMDIKRVRVDDEESLFYLIGMLMGIKYEKPKEDLVERYNEKYRGETYVFELRLDENLALKKNGEKVAQLSNENIKEQLAQIELVL